MGCGLGKTAHILKTKGFDVHCLSNDSYQEKAIAERYPDLPFTKSKFEENRLDRKFDLILMSESSQYMDWPKALAKVREMLNPGGYLLLSDYFRKTDDPYYRTCKVKAPFMDQTVAASFKLLAEEDITDHVLPTLDFGKFCFERYIGPAADILTEAIGEKTPPVVKGIFSLFLRKQLAKVRHYIFEKTPLKFDRGLFKEKMWYLIQLWQRT